MITFSEKHEHVRLDMSREDYNLMLLITGYSLGIIKLNDPDLFWPALEFVNELNAGNPQFTPYEIPAEHRGKREQLRLILPIAPPDWDVS